MCTRKNLMQLYIKSFMHSPVRAEPKTLRATKERAASLFRASNTAFHNRRMDRKNCIHAVYDSSWTDACKFYTFLWSYWWSQELQHSCCTAIARTT
eukprot:790083-Pelagomonas_calceolata.AAC.1